MAYVANTREWGHGVQIKLTECRMAQRELANRLGINECYLSRVLACKVVSRKMRMRIDTMMEGISCEKIT